MGNVLATMWCAARRTQTYCSRPSRSERIVGKREVEPPHPRRRAVAETLRKWCRISSSGIGSADEIIKGFAPTAVPDADVTEVADAIVRVVDAPFGKRPFRVHIDPASDGAEVVNAVADRVRVELLRNMGLADLQHPGKS